MRGEEGKMADNAVTPISSSSIGNADLTQNSLSDNNSLTSQLVSGNLDPKFASMLVTQMFNNNVNSILFGNEDTSGSSSTGNIDIFGTQAMSSQSNFNVLGQNSNFTDINPQFQMSVYSSLIGKTVTAKVPSTGEQITGKVSNVQLQNGQVVLNINDTLVPTSNLVKIQ
jgi:hypothetical protein